MSVPFVVEPELTFTVPLFEISEIVLLELFVISVIVPEFVIELIVPLLVKEDVLPDALVAVNPVASCMDSAEASVETVKLLLDGTPMLVIYFVAVVVLLAAFSVALPSCVEAGA